MTSLPNPATMVWICMECGQHWPNATYAADHFTKVVLDDRSRLVCPGIPVERLLVDPATTREGWLHEMAVGKWRVDSTPIRTYDYGPRVLVFDAPKEAE